MFRESEKGAKQVLIIFRKGEVADETDEISIRSFFSKNSNFIIGWNSGFIRLWTVCRHKITGTFLYVGVGSIPIEWDSMDRISERSGGNFRRVKTIIRSIEKS